MDLIYFKILITFLIIFIANNAIFYLLLLKNCKVLNTFFKENKLSDAIIYTKKHRFSLTTLYYKYYLALAYFELDDKESFHKLMKYCFSYTKAFKELTVCIELMNIIVYYMEDDIHNKEKIEKLLNITESRIHMLKDRDLIYIEKFYKITQLIYFYTRNEFSKAEEIYEKQQPINTNSLWAIANYYMCKIYDRNGERDKIDSIIEQADKRLFDNNYHSYFDSWRVV